MKNDLRDVYTAIDLSRVTYRRIRLNFAWALGYNLIAIPIAAGVLYPATGFHLPPGIAAAFEALSTFLVIISSVLLNFYRKPLIEGNIEFDSIGVAIDGSESAPLLIQSRHL